MSVPCPWCKKDMVFYSEPDYGRAYKGQYRCLCGARSPWRAGFFSLPRLEQRSTAVALGYKYDVPAEEDTNAWFAAAMRDGTVARGCDTCANACKDADEEPCNNCFYNIGSKKGSKDYWKWRGVARRAKDKNPAD